MKGSSSAHLSDEVLAALDEVRAALDEGGEREGSLARAHLRSCETCRRRRAELTGLRAMLAQTREREQAPRRDVVSGALKRLRLRRNAVTNVNEFFGSLVALVRGLATLLSAAELGEAGNARRGASEDDARG